MSRRRWVFAGLVGLAFARLWWDFGGADILAALMLVGGVALGWVWPRPYWTAFGLFVYLCAPAALPRLALLGLAFALVGWLAGLAQARSRNLWADVGAGGVALLLLTATLSPGLLPADAGEFQVVAATWGVAHPPGYPLYTMLAGGLAHLVPIEDMAWRVNWFSALTGAATVALMSAAIRRETRSLLAGWVAGFGLLTALTFWMTATQASIRPLMVFFTVAMLEAALAYRRAVKTASADSESPRGQATLIRFGLAAGFGVTHHGSLLFIGLALAACIALADARAWRRWLIPVVAALLGALPWFYLLARAEGFLAPDNLRSWDGFWNHVLARGFAGDMFAYDSPADWPERARVMWEVYRLQWETAGVLLLAAAGSLWALLRRDRWLGGLLIGAFVVHSIVVGTYRAPQTVEYALPAYVMLVAAVGWLVAQSPRIAGGVAVLVLALSFQSGWLTMRRLAASEEARIAAQNTLAAAPENALILSSWHRATPLWYLQEVEGARPDVEVRYVAPQGVETPMQTWVNAIQAAMQAGENVVVTQQFPEAFRTLPYRVVGENILPAAPLSTNTDSVQVLESAWPESARNGETIQGVVNWSLPQHEGALTTFIHLGAADSPPFAQADIRAAPASDVSLHYGLFIPQTTPPGVWSVWAGVYDEAGTLLFRQDIGQMHIQPGAFPTPSQHPIYRDMGGARLLGWDYDLTDTARLYLHWQIVETGRAYSISLLDREGGIWSPIAVQVGENGGYWTSVHTLPLDITRGGVSVQLDGETVRLPAFRGESRYILWGDAAALVGWRVESDGQQVTVNLEMLAMGATYADIQIQIAVEGDGGYRTADFTPVSGAIPSFKWGYGRTIRSQQVIPYAGTPESVRALLYDGFTGIPLTSSGGGALSLLSPD